MGREVTRASPAADLPGTGFSNRPAMRVYPRVKPATGCLSVPTVFCPDIFWGDIFRNCRQCQMGKSGKKNEENHAK